MVGQASDIQQGTDSDARSEVSYDPLFDDEPDGNGGPESRNNGQWQQTRGLNFPSSEGRPPTLAMPSQSMSQPSGRTSISSVAVPKNAPPLLDNTTYSTFSSDILMTASIDGQIILWDKRVNTPKKGVGRLEMSEKTPPWCVSVCHYN
jgi:transcriptional activator SPT8